MIRAVFRALVGWFSVLVSAGLLWVLGLGVGLNGGESLTRMISIGPTDLWIILFSAAELPVWIWLYFTMRRQMIPDGMNALFTGEITLRLKARYFPAIFSLGVLAGLVGEAAVFIVLFIVHYFQ